MESKTFLNIKDHFFERLQEENASGLDEVEGRLLFHDVVFHFWWADNQLTLELAVLPATFSGDEERAWDLVEDFIKSNGGQTHNTKDTTKTDLSIAQKS